MSELNPDQHQDSEGKKPLKASLTELLRVDVPGGPTMLSSRPGEREDEPAPAKQDELQMRTFWRRWKALMSASEQVAA